MNQLEIKPIDYEAELKKKCNLMINESCSYSKSLEIGKVAESSSIRMDANEKIKSRQEIEVNNFSIFNEKTFKPSINQKNSKLIPENNSTTNISNDSNKISNEENLRKKKRIEEQTNMMNYNIPMRMKSNSGYNDKLIAGNKTRESAKGPKEFLTGSKKMCTKRELDMSFLPKELLDDEKTYEQSNQNLLSAIEILEKAQKDAFQEKSKPKSFWDYINPFKCG